MAKTKAKKGKQVTETKASNMSPAEIKKFVDEVKVEFSKIVWPDRKVTLSLTGIVVVLSIVVSLYLGSVDFLLGNVVSSVLR